MMGKRSLGQITTFDFVLLLIVSESIQNGMVGNDYSITNALILVLVLTTLDIGLSLLKGRWPRFGLILEGTPLIVLENGKPLRDRMQKVRIDESDILTAARERQGLERLDQIKYAVLESATGASPSSRTASSGEVGTAASSGGGHCRRTSPGASPPASAAI